MLARRGSPSESGQGWSRPGFSFEGVWTGARDVASRVGRPKKTDKTTSSPKPRPNHQTPRPISLPKTMAITTTNEGHPSQNHNTKFPEFVSSGFASRSPPCPCRLELHVRVVWASSVCSSIWLRQLAPQIVGSGFFFVLDAGVRWFAGEVMSLITDSSPLSELVLWIQNPSGMLILSV